MTLLDCGGCKKPIMVMAMISFEKAGPPTRTPMRTIRGDLLALARAGAFDMIVHGCNCQCQMGKGIALAIRQQFPEAYAADCATEKGSREKLGSFSSAKVEAGGRSFTIVNAYTQFHWRGQGVKADYDAIRNVMRAIAAQFRVAGSATRRSARVWPEGTGRLSARSSTRSWRGWITAMWSSRPDQGGRSGGEMPCRHLR